MIAAKIHFNTSHGLSKTRIFTIWKGMKARCYNPKAFKYEIYGGKGVSMCEEWRDGVVAFYTWAMANGYRDDLTIDRVDSDGNYEPSNCRWATRSIQNRNRRKKNGSASSFLGISLQHHAKITRYVAFIRVNGKSKYLGWSHIEEDAARIRDKFIRDNNLVSEGYKLNF
jgi:hypothetical protein